VVRNNKGGIFGLGFIGIGFVFYLALGKGVFGFSFFLQQKHCTVGFVLSFCEI